MRLVVDANIVISAVIRRGKTLELLLDDELELFAPEFLFKEIRDHFGIIVKKSKLSRAGLALLLDSLASRFTIVPVRSFKSHLRLASRTCPDPDDIQYFALCESIDAPLWSNDKKLKDQETIKVLSTEEVISILSGKR